MEQMTDMIHEMNFRITDSKLPQSAVKCDVNCIQKRTYVRGLTNISSPANEPMFVSPRTYLLRTMLFFLLFLAAGNRINQVWAQSLPIVVTTTDDVNNGTEKLYWIASKGATGFYMFPHSDNKEVTTSNIPNERMLWFFLSAGDDGNGTSYYYIVNKSTGKYLKLAGDNGKDNSIQIHDYDAGADTKFKFHITQKTGGWLIHPYGTTDFYINKKSGNLSYTGRLKSSSYNDDNSTWNFVAKDDLTCAHPFTNSTSSEKHYYLLQNANPKTNEYFMSIDNGYVAVSISDNSRRVWYLKEASSDASIPQLKYYYIVNASTDKYMYFSGSKTDGSALSNAVQIQTYNPDGDEDRYQFAVLNTTGYSYEAYSIVPKKLLLLSNCYNKNISIGLAQNSMADLNHIGTLNDRNANENSAHWKFVATELICDKPVISFDKNTNEITITSETEDAVFYYTTDGSAPDTDHVGDTYSTKLYNSANKPTITSQTTINAVTTKGALPKSPVETKTIYKVSTPTIIYDAAHNAIKMMTSTDGATIHYTIATDESSLAVPSLSTPTTCSSGEALQDGISNRYIKAIAEKDDYITSDVSVLFNPVLLKCSMPVVKKNTDGTYLMTCKIPSSGVTVYYTTDGTTPATSSSTWAPNSSKSFPIGTTIKLMSGAPDYTNSDVVTKILLSGFPADAGDGTKDNPFQISSADLFDVFVDNVNTDGQEGIYYKITSNINVSGCLEVTEDFKGHLDGGFFTLDGLDHALFNTINGGTVKNVILQGVNINSDGDAGAICNNAIGTTRIYNCGILPTEVLREDPNDDQKVTGFSGSSVSGTGYVGGLVGSLEGTARVINCYSYANVSGGTNAAGLVGNNKVATTMSNLKTMVMNCMFYANITGATIMKPVYGGNIIGNGGTSGVNGYNYYRDGSDVTFDDDYANFEAYFCTLPADEEYLTRFEYYRSILNSNKKLCTWWINGTSGTAPTAADVDAVGIAKWVLDPAIAPYPILKVWGKYPSVINPDPDYVWNPKTEEKVSRSSAEPYQGKNLGTISVTVNAGAKYAGTGATSKTLSSVVIMDMDTLNNDYGYYKIQLPYYNEQFGDPSVQLPAPSADDYTSKWKQRYGGNYTDYVVTGWKITSVTGGTTGSFKGYSVASNGAVSASAVTPDEVSSTAWEDGFNFADRNCTNKDLYSKSGRVFAQGGYYYVPVGVKAITIEAYWGTAVYLHNKEHSLDRVNVAQGADGGSGAEYGTSFSPAGTLPDKFLGYDVQTTLQDAIGKLTKSASLTVYDQAIVLVGNVQVKNRSQSVGDNTVTNRRPFTIMSIDEDMDNEPDYCLEFQFRQKVERPGIHPVRFDFLPVPELGLAIRTDQKAYAIGIFIPQGHFEITETSFMHTTQFEYDSKDINRVESPIILNGGHFEQIVVRYGPKDKVSYFLLGGHFRMRRFTPGYHANNNNPITGGNVRHCAVNAIGGDYPEFYLSGVYRPDWTVNADNPHCYINGGKFGTLAGAAYEQVNGSVTFKIDHAIIEKFYGGGMNGAKPVTGNIDVTINNSIVYDIFCGGPMVGQMTKPDGGTRKTVTTTADKTFFGRFFGGGNGGTSYYREQAYDDDIGWPSDWKANTYKFPEFNPLNTISGKTKQYNADKGYHDLFEFEVFNSSNGLNENCVARTFIQWAQFGTTKTGKVTNTLTNCTVENDFYGGGNLGTVDGDVVSTLTNTRVKGSVFGGGYSAEIPRFRMHDVNNVHVPTRNKAGLIDEEGYLDYVQDAGKDRYYRWTNDNNGSLATTNEPTYWSDTDKEYKCYTPISLVGLGEVDGNVTLTINGTSQIDGNVFGGGDASKVNGSATVTLMGNTQVEGNVFGGGNNADVGGGATVNIQD